eukprot:CAMPEP_0115754892 /NCGR_PEP_ID=MMETSP0272-20121206/97104_1 /TAXON_ID=71861 /ORGANISM="Scrippsiella trochoidea, Strain CCMP3099" /LENGTH=116 /DNA_ID=CAMNT_0003200313 /DNA_START=125 /DNA_END=476 /DNA_ORIENTATION=-
MSLQRLDRAFGMSGERITCFNGATACPDAGSKQKPSLNSPWATLVPLNPGFPEQALKALLNCSSVRVYMQMTPGPLEGGCASSCTKVNVWWKSFTGEKWTVQELGVSSVAAWRYVL